MATSQNGYTANDRSLVGPFVISSAGKTILLRKGPVGELLSRFLRWFDANIRDIDPGPNDEWGYAERPIRGGTELSNHASGTAADVDATKWPLGVAPTSYLTLDEIARVNAELARYQGCIRWGATYQGRKDPMHFEAVKSEAECKRVLDLLNAVPTPPPSKPLYAGKGPVFPLPKGYYYGPRSGPVQSVSGYAGRGEGLGVWQARMKQRGWSIQVTSRYDAATERVARAFQQQCGRGITGRIGPDEWWDAWNVEVTR